MDISEYIHYSAEKVKEAKPKKLLKKDMFVTKSRSVIAKITKSPLEP